MPKVGNQAVAEAVGDAQLDTDATVEVLNRILHFELDGVMQHFHHHWMSRWLRACRGRAITVGQHIAALTGGPSVGIGQLIDDGLVSSEKMLEAARAYEKRRGDAYRRLLELAEGRSDALEAFARAQLDAGERRVPELTVDDYGAD